MANLEITLKPDGAGTDDQPQIQAALNAVLPAGGVLRLAAGISNVANTVNLGVASGKQGE